MARSTPPKKQSSTISKPPETNDLDLAWTEDAFFGKAKPPTSPKPAAPGPVPAAAAPAPFPPAAAPSDDAEADWTEDEFFGTVKAPPAVAAPAAAPAPALTPTATPSAVAAPPQAAPAKHAATVAFGTASGHALELASVRAASIPPPLAPGANSIDEIRSRFEVGDCSGALLMAEAILETDPTNAEVLRYVEQCQAVLQKMYIARLGGLNRIPLVATSAEQMRWLSLDHRAGFVLSLIDGACTFDEILDMSGMRRLDALRILFDLLQQNVIAVA